MTPESLFSLVNTLVLPGWILLVFAPGWRGTQRITTLLLPSLLAVAYVFLLVTHWGEAKGGFGTLADVSSLFQDRSVLLAGWIHYLAFDLFVGSWIARDARRLGITHAAVVPCLLLTFLLGPSGLLVYLVLRTALRRVRDPEASGSAV